ncbi:type III pantothenate kinase [Williamwhitmania taraxaci]|uniref:Type III pantothenate kinase n=1 Tax=Williamwhitmania taraxaci TaxID=1640674 RepID=A0A1G6L588_9BACT|nr:type III pantothenate kinase [Williamwhitmania taraxaci]SDC38482.1 type III pantothenate kinase [Williamwhitmania taraxaci]
MNLILDLGNTRAKVAKVNRYGIVALEAFNYDQLERLAQFTHHHEAYKGIIIGSVIDIEAPIVKEIINFLPQKPLILTHKTLIPIINNYQTPETLGLDRLAAAVGANNNFPHSNVLVIDIGTAITYDLINSNGVYLGGNISPGINIRLKALNAFTSKLPLVEANFRSPLFGTNTIEAIQAGTFHGITAEIDGIIEKFMTIYPNLTVILTGGDANNFAQNLKNAIFVNFNIVIEGLNSILEYNKNAENK